MFAIQCDELELLEAWSDVDPELRGRFDFPISFETGAASTSVVYFEVAPGEHCGRHKHSAEEVLLILEGNAEAEVGDERGPASRGGLVLVPAMVGHDVRNIGSETLRVVGFFSSAAVVTDIEERLEPMGTKMLVIGASEPADVG
jgi:mannose-6-phosphate isomerase-like protein (cupin superfamily)